MSILFVLIAGFCFSSNAAAQPSRTLEDLERRITLVLLETEGVSNRRQELLKLAAREEVAAVLLRMLERTRSERRNDNDSTFNSAIRSKSISALGELGEVRAAPLIQSVLNDRTQHGNVRTRAAKALAQIDVSRHKGDILRVFDEVPANDWIFRLGLARALVNANDRAVIAKMEAWTRGEANMKVRRMFEKVVDDMKRQLGPP